MSNKFEIKYTDTSATLMFGDAELRKVTAADGFAFDKVEATNALLLWLNSMVSVFQDTVVRGYK